MFEDMFLRLNVSFFSFVDKFWFPGYCTGFGGADFRNFVAEKSVPDEDDFGLVFNLLV